jgi:hypothetical protein
MADLPQVLATYDALVGVALGAGLTYGFSALNRRQQEKREDKTRWYQARLEAYTEFYRAVSDGWLLVEDEPTEADHKAFASRLSNALGLIQLVGSAEAFLAAHALFIVQYAIQPTEYSRAAWKSCGCSVSRLASSVYRRSSLARRSAREWMRESR